MKKTKKTKKSLIKKAWGSFSSWIKKRDTDWRGNGHCITCGKILNLEDNPNECHAGHYEHGRTKESYYDPKNVHLQCRQCNYYGGSKVVRTYTAKIIQMYGAEKEEQLRNAKTHYWNIKELEEIIIKYS